MVSGKDYLFNNAAIIGLKCFAFWRVICIQMGPYGPRTPLRCVSFHFYLPLQENKADMQIELP